MSSRLSACTETYVLVESVSSSNSIFIFRECILFRDPVLSCAIRREARKSRPSPYRREATRRPRRATPSRQRAPESKYSSRPRSAASPHVVKTIEVEMVHRAPGAAILVHYAESGTRGFLPPCPARGTHGRDKGCLARTHRSAERHMGPGAERGNKFRRRGIKTSPFSTIISIFPLLLLKKCKI